MTVQEYINQNLDIFQKFLHGNMQITADNVFQKGNTELQQVITSFLLQLARPDSHVIGAEHLYTLLEHARQGKRCLILPEHYSNLDYPLIITFFSQLGEKGKQLAQACVAMAGVKLSEERSIISMITSAYDRVYVYPSRSLKAITNPNVLAEETKKARAINFASMRYMDTLRSEGRVVVVFPTGTRYRPGKPETKKAIREIDSYIKTSDYAVLLSINGNCLHISENEDMAADELHNETMIFEASEVIDCKTFREDIIKSVSEDEDKKQKIADEIMRRLEVMHLKNEAEVVR